MFGVVPRPLWLKRATPDAENRILMGSNTVVVRDGKRTVVIETGWATSWTRRCGPFTERRRCCSLLLPRRASAWKKWTW